MCCPFVAGIISTVAPPTADGSPKETVSPSVAQEGKQLATLNTSIAVDHTDNVTVVCAIGDDQIPEAPRLDAMFAALGDRLLDRDLVAFDGVVLRHDTNLSG
jgi:hypothetical protein